MTNVRHDRAHHRRVFRSGLLRAAMLAGALVGASLVVGILGSHHFARLGWVDAFYAASMIMSGMGPTDALPTREAKLFAGIYALMGLAWGRQWLRESFFPFILFIFCVPNDNFLPNLSIARFLDKLGLKGLARGYRAFFNRISRHHHCDDPETWRKRLEQAGFRMEKYWHYFSPSALAALEWGHYLGLPSLISHVLFRRWILVPTRWNLAPTLAALRPYYNEPVPQEKGAYTFYIARRV